VGDRGGKTSEDELTVVLLARDVTSGSFRIDGGNCRFLKSNTMKALLGSLMCLVFTVTQSFAISGGPWSGPGHVTVTGTYAGVLVPKTIDNSVVLFTLVVPQTGLTSGTSVVFRNGIFYSGTVQGSADPDSAKVTAILNAVFLQISSISSGTTSSSISIAAEYDANGQFDAAKIVSHNNVGSISSTRIRGSAVLTYKNLRNDGDPPDPAGEGTVTYKIKGFKQSEATN
jgi:hypothetical protein